MQRFVCFFLVINFKFVLIVQDGRAKERTRVKLKMFEVSKIEKNCNPFHFCDIFVKLNLFNKQLQSKEIITKFLANIEL